MEVCNPYAHMHIVCVHWYGQHVTRWASEWVAALQNAESCIHFEVRIDTFFYVVLSFFFFFGSLFVCVHIYVKHNRLYSLVSFFFSSSFIDGSRLMGILLVFHEIIRLWCQRQRLSSARLRHLMRSSWAELQEQWCLLNYFLLPPNRTRFRLSCLNMWFLHCYDSLFDSFWPFHRINYMVWFSHVYMYNIYKWSSECNASNTTSRHPSRDNYSIKS